MTPPEVFTIGVYGYTEEAFLAALREAGVDTFCDVRRRRGLRGSEYAFANAKRLQASLEGAGIRYLHFVELSPENELRERQYQEDRETGTAKRQRTALGQTFIDGYRDTCLAGFNSGAFVNALGPGAKRVALFCVERDPAACHRSLLAERLERDLGTKVTHLTP